MTFQVLLYLISKWNYFVFVEWIHFSRNLNICTKTFSQSLFQKEGFEILGCSFVSALELRSTSSAEQKFPDKITKITWKTKQNLEIWPFLKTRLEKWVWESDPKIDPATGVTSTFKIGERKRNAVQYPLVYGYFMTERGPGWCSNLVKKMLTQSF